MESITYTLLEVEKRGRRTTPVSVRTHKGQKEGSNRMEENVRLSKPNARLPPSGVTACGVLWVEPGDPMTRRPSSIVLI